MLKRIGRGLYACICIAFGGVGFYLLNLYPLKVQFKVAVIVAAIALIAKGIFGIVQIIREVSHIRHAVKYGRVLGAIVLDRKIDHHTPPRDILTLYAHDGIKGDYYTEITHGVDTINYVPGTYVKVRAYKVDVSIIEEVPADEMPFEIKRALDAEYKRVLHGGKIPR